MCGIVGFIEGDVPRKKVLQDMMDRIVHRGPDGSGIYLDTTIALGHRRLSVIDIEGGSQPMTNEAGNLICIFNGEIYNYKEIRKELIRFGHVFLTDSDTEVLLHGYEQWGSKLPNRLRGMFAFALWDNREKELFCARDYFGIKPFYYYIKENAFLFGSEIKSFLAHPLFEKNLNQKQLELYLSYQYSPGEDTFFEHVYKLQPAHFLLWKDGNIKTERYWKPEFASDAANTKTEWKRQIEKVIQDSVLAHKISDVEVGSFLSSGIDSGYVAGLSKVKKTFTIGYDQMKYNEAHYAHTYSKIIGAENTVYQIHPEEFWEKLPDIQYYMDEPLGDAAGAALYFLNREASKQVKVCLSGEGADELFGGYHIYKEPFTYMWYDRLPVSIRKVIGKLAEKLPSAKGINFLIRRSCPPAQRYIGNTTIFTEHQKKKIMKQYSGKVLPADLSRPYFQEFSKADTVTCMQYTDINLWLVGDILLKADKMSMANSLELRVPFLDREVFDVVRQIPVEYKVDAQNTKMVLREAAETVIGSDFAKREKKGFPVPVREWLREEPYVSRVRACFESSTAEQFFRTDMLIRLLDEHRRGKHDNWRQIWCVYMFLLWYKEYFIDR